MTFKEAQKDIERKFDLLYQKYHSILKEHSKVKQELADVQHRYEHLLGAMNQAKSDIKEVIAFIKDAS
ncbi:MAG: hypothetical protein ACON5A_02115 [Candidatus Comchoanobacterales bacterium]